MAIVIPQLSSARLPTAAELRARLAVQQRSRAPLAEPVRVSPVAPRVPRALGPGGTPFTVTSGAVKPPPAGVLPPPVLRVTPLPPAVVGVGGAGGSGEPVAYAPPPTPSAGWVTLLPNERAAVRPAGPGTPPPGTPGKAASAKAPATPAPDWAALLRQPVALPGALRAPVWAVGVAGLVVLVLLVR